MHPQPVHSRLTGGADSVDGVRGEDPIARRSLAVTLKLSRQPAMVRERMIDRLPPQSLEAEQSVLGAILIDRDAVVEVAEFLRPADFYRQANGAIFAAILELFERREPIDIVLREIAAHRTRRSTALENDAKPERARSATTQAVTQYSTLVTPRSSLDRTRIP